jgi:hypothetical protein
LEDTPRALVVFEEFQEGLGRSQVEQFGRLLALARYKKVGLFFINQQPSQVSRVDPNLLRALHTNTNLLAIFRSNLEDARAMSHALPVPADERERRSAREVLVEELTRLPDRTFRLWLRQAPFRAQRVRSPRLDLAELRHRAASLSHERRSFIQCGISSLPREELESLVSEHRSEDTEPSTSVSEFLIPTDVGEEESTFPRIG